MFISYTYIYISPQSFLLHLLNNVLGDCINLWLVGSLSWGYSVFAYSYIWLFDLLSNAFMDFIILVNGFNPFINLVTLVYISDYQFEIKN